MVSIDVHNVNKVKPEVRKFSGFNVLYLYIESIKDDGTPSTDQLILYLDRDTKVPINLLNQLGPAIEKAVNY